jgi:hypothetical protein
VLGAPANAEKAIKATPRMAAAPAARRGVVRLDIGMSEVPSMRVEGLS